MGRGVSISGWALIGLAALILILPLKWVAAAIAAAGFHECCHLIASRLVGCKIRSVDIHMGGAVIGTDAMLPWQELVCVLAGPVGGLMLLLLVRWFPRLAICAGIHSLYNLLPLYPLDGGRAVRCLCRFFLPPDRGEALCEGMELLCRLGLLFLAFYGTAVRHLGIMPLLGVGLILLRTKNRKIPCKRMTKAVQ